jgi:hypothetical protein
VNPEYLGDAVYATNDGHMVELRLNSHTAPVAIYLEPEVMEALINYYRREIQHYEPAD